MGGLHRFLNIFLDIYKEVVMLYLSQPTRQAYVPESKVRKKFSKISLESVEQKNVEFELGIDDWGYIDPNFSSGLKRKLEFNGMHMTCIHLIFASRSVYLTYNWDFLCMDILLCRYSP